MTTLPSKASRVLRALLDGPRTSRELELAPVHDHCSHSTVADLRRAGCAITTERVTIRGYGGAPAYVARWSIPDADRARATEILDRMERRGARGCH